MSLLKIELQSRQKEEFIDITDELVLRVAKSDVNDGICLLNVPHTTASLLITSTADHATPRDILDTLDQIAPTRRQWKHHGNPDDAEAHVKSAIVGVSISLPIEGGRPVLGSNQSVVLCEFDGPRTREVLMTIWENRKDQVS